MPVLSLRKTNDKERSFPIVATIPFAENEDYHDKIPEEWRTLVSLLDACDLKEQPEARGFLCAMIENLGWKNVHYRRNDWGELRVEQVEYYDIPHVRPVPDKPGNYYWFAGEKETA